MTEYCVPTAAGEASFTEKRSEFLGHVRPVESEEEARALTHAYTTLRDALHHLALQELPGHVAPEAFSREREQVSASWQKWLMA